jgi:hypothetical protein
MPVSLGELIPGNAELASLTDGHDVASCIDNLGACMWQHLADGGESRLDAVGGEGVEAGGRSLRQAWSWGFS